MIDEQDITRSTSSDLVKLSNEEQVLKMRFGIMEDLVTL